jgi:hypothetical protein
MDVALEPSLAMLYNRSRPFLDERKTLDGRLEDEALSPVGRTAPAGPLG